VGSIHQSRPLPKLFTQWTGKTSGKDSRLVLNGSGVQVLRSGFLERINIEDISSCSDSDMYQTDFHWDDAKNED